MSMPFRDASFDASVCLFGLMYFPDRVAALVEVRRLLRTGARLALTVWGPAARVPYAGLMGEALAAAQPAAASDSLLPFALSDPNEVERIMTAAGLAGVTLTRLTRTARFDSESDYFDPYEQGAGRLGQIYLQLDDAARTKVRRTVLAELEGFRTGTGFAMDLEAWLASGRA
jgi:SAM-dependent methyltransferase